MKSKLSHLALPTAALCWLLSIAATGCIATAFDLPLTGGMGFLILLLGLFAGLVCLAFDRCKLAVPILLFLCAQLLLMFSFRKNPAQMQTLLPSITEYYQRAYGWPIVLENGPFAQYADLALLQVGLIICFFLCWALMRRRPLLVCLLPLSPLLSCIVVYDTIPSGLYLFLLLLGLTVLWLTHSARRKREVPIGMQSIKLAPIAALCLAVLFLVVPQTDSINPLRKNFGPGSKTGSRSFPRLTKFPAIRATQAILSASAIPPPSTWAQWVPKPKTMPWYCMQHPPRAAVPICGIK